jgi:hypothetical protein
MKMPKPPSGTRTIASDWNVLVELMMRYVMEPPLYAIVESIDSIELFAKTVILTLVFASK